jgi:K+-transporting ATPase KdpF subunit
MSTRANSCEGDQAMIFDYSLAALVTAGLLIYLVYALLKPELF